MRKKTIKKRAPRVSTKRTPKEKMSKDSLDKLKRAKKYNTSKKTVARKYAPQRLEQPKSSADAGPGVAISLSKYIAINGICSRRKAVELIADNKVTVNNKIVTEPGRKIAETDRVYVNSVLVQQEPKMYILLNKPKDYIATVSDEKGRKTVMELVPELAHLRLYPVGRLDRSTTGLLVLTNDGELAQRLSHPKYEVSKIYEVVLDVPIKQSDFKSIVDDGVELEDGHVTVDAMAILPGENKRVVAIEIHSGKNRVVRRVFEHFGYKVQKLDRIEYAGLTKHNLRAAQWRHLSPHEVNTLKKRSAKNQNQN